MTNHTMTAIDTHTYRCRQCGRLLSLSPYRVLEPGDQTAQHSAFAASNDLAGRGRVEIYDIDPAVWLEALEDAAGKETT